MSRIVVVTGAGVGGGIAGEAVRQGLRCRTHLVRRQPVGAGGDRASRVLCARVDDAGSLPWIGTVNPNRTIISDALRVGDHLGARLSA